MANSRWMDWPARGASKMGVSNRTLLGKTKRTRYSGHCTFVADGVFTAVMPTGVRFNWAGNPAWSTLPVAPVSIWASTLIGWERVARRPGAHARQPFPLSPGPLRLDRWLA